MQFFETVSGNKFINGTIPKFIEAFESVIELIRERNEIEKAKIAAIKDQTAAVQDLTETLKWTSHR